MASPDADLAAFLACTEVFQGLDHPVLQKLKPQFEYVSLRGGDVLMREGDPGDCLYVVLTGRLLVFVTDPGDQGRNVGEIGPGEVVGEMALLSDEPRSATVKAMRDTKLVRLSKAAFESLVESAPAAMMQITRLIVKRFQRLLRSPRVVNTVRTIAVIPTSQDVSLSESCLV